MSLRTSGGSYASTSAIREHPSHPYFPSAASACTRLSSAFCRMLLIAEALLSSPTPPASSSAAASSIAWLPFPGLPPRLDALPVQQQ
jgi:hypothetical protein